MIAGTATGDSPCEKAAPTPASPGELGTGGGGSVKASVIAGEHGARGMVKQEPLTHAQRVELQQQMAEARTAAAAYPTVASAEAAGYQRSTVYVPCIGAHYTNAALAIGFDPSHPSELLYDGSTPDAKIVGLSYLVYHHNGPPPGFAGDNDHWHQHNANGGLCLRGGEVVGGEETSRAECAARWWAQDVAHRHLDAPRVGRARVRVHAGACSAASAPSWAAASAGPRTIRRHRPDQLAAAGPLTSGGGTRR